MYSDWIKEKIFSYDKAGKNIMRSKKIKKLSLEDVFGKRKNNDSETKVTEPIEIWKYFCNNTSFHGIKYRFDTQLPGLERRIWSLIFLSGFIASIYIICLSYDKYQDRKANIIVDELQANLTNVPFPTVTICPISKASKKDINETVKKLLPNSTEKTKNILKEALYQVSDVHIAKLDLVDFDVKGSESDELNEVNLTHALLMIAPKCDEILFNCTWFYKKVDCCEIFDLQKTYYGFCYAFNSQTSLNNSLSEPKRITSSDSMSGLTVTVQSEMFVNKQADVMIDDPWAYATKGNVVNFGQHYEIPIRFAKTYSEPEVLALETIPNPPCKYQNGTYRLANCRDDRLKEYFQKRCNCTPASFFDQLLGDLQECRIKDIECIEAAIRNVRDLIMYKFSNGSDMTENCSVSCEYYYYDSFTIDQPGPSDSLSLDVHFDSRTGIRYKRVIVITELDMLVQFGGIFGLFVGGSLLSLMEFIHAFLKSICSRIHHFYKQNSQTKKIKVNHTVAVIPYTN